ncbi:DUF6090 family protein [Mangrovivirga cuniculi]|nr:DUF6090 family protein [Mangrovivirga cuniculi]
MRIFRSIRKNLLDGKNLKKYISYALGEIVLLVIGILIALAINNKNISYDKARKEQLYLKGLKKEFTTSKRKLSELIRVNRINYLGARDLVNLMNDSSIKINEKDFSLILFNSFAYDISFNPNNSLLYEMINSGSLRDISDNNLRIQLTNYLSTIEDISKQEDDLAEQRKSVLDTFRKNYSIMRVFDDSGISKGDLGIQSRKNNISNLDILSDKEFENNLLIFILTSLATEESHYQPLLEEMDFILKSIESNINE